MKGCLKWFNSERGYGFITADDGKDYFVHATELAPGTYHDDDQVIFEVVGCAKGVKAVNVKLA